MGGFVFIIGGILVSGQLDSYWDIPSIFIVLGGTFAATLASFPLKKFLNTSKVIKKPSIIKIHLLMM